MTEPGKYLELSKKLLAELNTRKREIAKYKEPIAVVGMACRFPGGQDLLAFWRELEAGASAVTRGRPDAGEGRGIDLFPDTASGADVTPWGAYIDAIDWFDAEFFRVAPVEARLLDPQQRLLLETSWQALEDAGIAPGLLKGSRTGVFAGITTNDYRHLVTGGGNDSGGLYVATGNSGSTAIGRIAFALGLEGPAMAIDTACSSALVAVHQAAASLQRGEADLALAGGVNAILSPGVTKIFADAGVLSGRGRCSTFDAAADGYVRGEGCGVLVLKRLSDAEADGDRIWGVIRGSAVNQDGASAGLTVPNGPAQERVIEEALQRAGVHPSEVDYLEAHGTGTELGDPIEVQAAAAVYGKDRAPERPLLIGSVKTNIGHLEAAAGVAGLIKVILSMSRQLIPPHLHFINPSPHIDWGRLPVQVTSAAVPWPSNSQRPARAGISSFGFSGTNAHVIVEGYGKSAGEPAEPFEVLLDAGPARKLEVSRGQARDESSRTAQLVRPRRTRMLPLSGRSAAAVRDLTRRYLAWLEERGELLEPRPGDSGDSCGETPSSLLADLAWTASVGRGHFDHRAGVAFRDVSDLRTRLAGLSESEEEAARGTASTIAFVFSGQGSQWAGMGLSLYETEPIARDVLDRCDRVVRESRDVSLLDVMFGRAGAAGDLDDTAWTQPALYALECALAALWESVGIRPSAVLGHSVGEIAAAHVAGVFSLEDGLRFAAARGEAMARMPSDGPEAGAMAAVFASARRVASVVAEVNAGSDGFGLDIAANNGAHHVVSGPTDLVASLVERLAEDGVRVERLNASHAFHSALVEPVLDDLETALEGMAISRPSLGLVSNVTGHVVAGAEVLDAAYWRRHARETVEFAAGIAALAQMGVDLVVEIGPQPVLGPIALAAWPVASDPPPASDPDGSGGRLTSKADDAETPSQPMRLPTVAASLRREFPSASGTESEDAGEFADAVAAVYSAGASLSFEGLFLGETRRRLALPSYPFQRQQFWVGRPKRSGPGGVHALLGLRHESPHGEITFENEMAVSDPAWLGDHRVFQRAVAPAALHGSLAMAAASVAVGGNPAALEDFRLKSPLILPEGGNPAAREHGRAVQVVVSNPAESGTRSVEIFSKGPGEDVWALHAEARLLQRHGNDDGDPQVDLEALRGALAATDPARLYANLEATGIEHGWAFRRVEAIWSGPGEAIGEVALPLELDQAGLDPNPMLLDACFQVLAATQDGAGRQGQNQPTYLPVGWDRLWLSGPLPERVVCHARIARGDGEGGPGGDRADSLGREAPGTLTADLRFYESDGRAIGGVTGFTLRRTTRSALLAGVERVNDLLYEVLWRERPWTGAGRSAAFLADPSVVAARTRDFSECLAGEGLEVAALAAFVSELERLSRSHALRVLERLGWKLRPGERVVPAEFRQRLKVVSEHERLFQRLLAMIAEAGVLVPVADADDEWEVASDAGGETRDTALGDPEELSAGLRERYPHGVAEIGLLTRCGTALPQVLRGLEDPLGLLYSARDSGAASLYSEAPAIRAANRMVGDAIAAALGDLPPERQLRVLEVGAGTGGTTASVLAALPAGRFDYVYTDVSAGFFAGAETRFQAVGSSIDYRVLDIEAEVEGQGFEPHGYDLVIAANVLHATRDLGQTLEHCRELLAPSGLLVALEGMRRQGWLDLTFGLLGGWWRFEDSYRSDSALAGEATWRQALADSGFGDVSVLEAGQESDASGPVQGVIVARAPQDVVDARGAWLLAAGTGGVVSDLAGRLAARNQAVVVAGDDAGPGEALAAIPGVRTVPVALGERDAWRSVVQGLPAGASLRGVIHLAALDSRGPSAGTAELAEDTTRIAGSALALVQGLADAGVVPPQGAWFLTRGAQVLPGEHGNGLAGSTLWGFGKVLALELPQLQARFVDLDPSRATWPESLVDELLSPDRETHLAYRLERRHALRLVRREAVAFRAGLPDEGGWRLARGPAGGLEELSAEEVPSRRPGSGEILIKVEAVGLNFHDVLAAMGVLDADAPLGGEFCGHVAETGPDVSSVSAGDRVVGFAAGALGPEVIARAELVAPVQPGIPAATLATLPAAFVTSGLAFEAARLGEGERVLIHAGAGGVGHAAIRMAMATGAEVFATASRPKHGRLHSLGVEQVFDSRTTSFGEEILAATGGKGVDVVLNSLTGPGFIEASLSCLGQGGQFIEIARREIWSADKMAAARPDVGYHVVELDRLIAEDPARVGSMLRKVTSLVVAGELKPIPFSAWPLADAGAAMDFMRQGRHVGKVVLTAPALASGGLRKDRTYLVTGGFGGLGREIAVWLADRGAGAIVLNGRRHPDAGARKTIESLRDRGVLVSEEVADVQDAAEVEGMLARIDAEMPPLAGVVHCVGVLADGSVENQSWDRFERVLWPKMLGAWTLHRATMCRDLDLFLLFSSMTGVLGNTGQSNHAAANAFLDELARHRRSQGLAGQSIAWGPWSGLGEAEGERARIAERMERGGIGWIEPQQGLRALDILVRQDVPANAVAAVDWSVFVAGLPAGPPMLEELLAATRSRSLEAVPRPSDLVAQLRPVSVSEREAILISFLQAEVQAVLRLPSPPKPDVGFFELGMDSLMAVELRNRLNRAFSGQYVLSNTEVFDYPDTAGLARHLAAKLAGSAESAVVPEGHELAKNVPSTWAENDRIAIIGMACQFPGAEDVEAFWRQLASGSSAVTEGRPDSADGNRRAPLAGALAGVGQRRWGAYIEDIDRFDAEFFGIAPVEARLMDPQQRILLETSWQALEESGIAPGLLKGSRTAVFAGISTNDYRDLISSSTGDEVAFYAATGTSNSAAIGRIAFSLGLEGPAMAVDTACSSSLVAVHQAVAALQRGEADLALAGGVNAILSAAPTDALADAGMLAPDGLCKTFDASANGFVRGEGCGVVVLKRLSDAEADGDFVRAVINGSAVNQDGASAGLTVPNGPAQQRVIVEALVRAGVEPSEVDYLEAHGTGTELGDPIEVHAAAAVYGRGRQSDRPLLVGSVKTNIGHLEAAAGVAGLIKAVLSIEHGLIPRHLNFREPNPRIDWEGLPVRVASDSTAWPVTSGRPVRAAVSSFGFSGTNAHLIVEGYGARTDEPGLPKGALSGTSKREQGAASGPQLAVRPPARDGSAWPRRLRLVPLSAKSPGALRDLAGRYLAWLDKQVGVIATGDGDSGAESVGREAPFLPDAAWTAALGRTHFDHRAGLVFRGSGELRQQLERLARADGRPVASAEPRVAFVFTGQGSQWVGMGRTLFETQPVARTVLTQCDEVIRELRGESLLDVMFGRESARLNLNDTAWTQPALYALECALAALWASVGIRPMAVLGHSVGEIAAAHVAGVFGLEDGLRFAAARGELMARMPSEGPGAGAMAAVFASPERVAAALDEVNAGSDETALSVAADNGTHMVVSGTAVAVKVFADRLSSDGVRVVPLHAGHGFHSQLVDPVLDDLESALDGVPLASPTVALVSNVTGRVVNADQILDGAYWRRQARETVAFRAGVAALAELGVDLVAEIGPHPVLGPIVELAWPAMSEAERDSSADSAGGDGTSSETVAGGPRSPTPAPPAVVHSLREPPAGDRAPGDDSDTGRAFLEGLATAYECGARVAFEGLFAGETRRKIRLPAYPFQRQRHWIGSPRRRRAKDHPLLGQRHESPRGDVMFDTELFASDPEWLGDHRLFGRVVVPAALHGTLAVATASLTDGSGPLQVDGLRLRAPLILPGGVSDRDAEERGRSLQVVARLPEQGPGRIVEIFSKGDGEESWTLHAEARAVTGIEAASGERIDLRALKERLSPRGIQAFYGNLAATGAEYGPSFQSVEAVWSGHGEAVGEVALPRDLRATPDYPHPALLDGCFQVLSAAALVGQGDGHITYLPIELERLWLRGPLPERVVCHASIRGGEASRAVSGDHKRPDGGASAEPGALPEVVVADLRLCAPDGAVVGWVTGFTVKRTTRSALVAAAEAVNDLLYEVSWQQLPAGSGMRRADFLPDPGAIEAKIADSASYLAAEGVDPGELNAFLRDLDRLACAYAMAALQDLGWRRKAGSQVRPRVLRRRLKVLSDHERLLGRLFEMLAHAGVLASAEDREDAWIVVAGAKDSLQDELLGTASLLREELAQRHPYGANEVGLLSRCGEALADVLRGRTDPLELLFPDRGAGAADLYREAPAMRAANRMVEDAVASALERLPGDVRLQVLEVGAGTGGTTASVLRALPEGRFDYVYTDVSAGFFAGAEARFGGTDVPMQFRALDIESDPVAQGFEAHSFHIVIAANVLHATRDLGETLAHCRDLLAPSGLLVALEGLREQFWLDLTFGLLAGWWRFEDSYRARHALAGESAWRQALANARFSDVSVLPLEQGGEGAGAVQGLLLARRPGRRCRFSRPLVAGWRCRRPGFRAGGGTGGAQSDRGAGKRGFGACRTPARWRGTG